MSRLKISLSIIMVMAVILGRVGSVQAAPPQQEEVPITGSIQGVEVEADLETVVVTLLVDGEVQTVRVSVKTAAGLGLFVLDEMGMPVMGSDGKPLINGAVLGTNIGIYPSTILPAEPPTDGKQHPIAVKISDFFSGLLGVDYELVMGMHTDGFGFGVITQSLWITNKLGGDTSLFQTILDAKRSGDYSLVTLPSGAIPQNWGQFKNAVLKGDDGNSLGDVNSGTDNQSGTPGTDNGKDNGNGKPNDPGNGNGKPENPGNGNGRPENPGNSNKPDTPPGQTKDKDKDNNGNNKVK